MIAVVALWAQAEATVDLVYGSASLHELVGGHIDLRRGFI